MLIEKSFIHLWHALIYMHAYISSIFIKIGLIFSFNGHNITILMFLSNIWCALINMHEFNVLVLYFSLLFFCGQNNSSNNFF